MIEVKPNKYGYIQSDLKHYFKYYLGNNMHKQPKVKDRTLYSNIVRFLFERIWYYMIKELWVFKPVGKNNTFLGKFFIKEIPTDLTNTYIDYKATREKGRLVKRPNLHTDGKMFKITWSSHLRRAKNLSLYYFQPYRGEAGKLTGKRGLAAYIKECSVNSDLKDYRAYVL